MEFARAIASLRDVDEARDFLADLLTERERADLIRRFQAARMLAEGKKYGEIMFYIRMNPSTIAQVAEVLEGGHRILQKIFERVPEVRPKPTKRSPDPDTLGRYLRGRIRKGK